MFDFEAGALDLAIVPGGIGVGDFGLGEFSVDGVPPFVLGLCQVAGGGECDQNQDNNGFH